MMSVEFLAEIVREPLPDEERVRYRYIQDDVSEVTISVEWWVSLGRPEYIQVKVEPDRQELEVGRDHE